MQSCQNHKTENCHYIIAQEPGQQEPSMQHYLTGSTSFTIIQKYGLLHQLVLAQVKAFPSPRIK